MLTAVYKLSTYLPCMNPVNWEWSELLENRVSDAGLLGSDSAILKRAERDLWVDPLLRAPDEKNPQIVRHLLTSSQ